MALRIRLSTIFIACLALVIGTVFPPVVAASFAATTLNYDFNTAGTLATNFNRYASAGSITEVATGGISNSGAINVPSGSGGVFTTKTSYSMGPVGSAYEFTSYMYIDGSNGYGGMGFTTTPVPSGANTTSANGPLAPNDALGISVHGGGFLFLNGLTKYEGLWTSTSNAGIVTEHAGINSQLLNTNLWWKVIFNVTRRGSTTFDLKVEVRPTDSAGVVLTANDYAIMSISNVSSSALANAASINTYFNFSGDRVRYFDNYSVNLAGGSSVVAENAPVVLTVGAADANNVVTVDGNVTAAGSSSVTARGFVYSTSAAPTLSNSVLQVGTGTGTYQGTTSVLPGGTYYFRAYATNSTGTTYGSENQLTLAALATPVASPSATVATELAQTGFDAQQLSFQLSLSLVAFMSGAALVVHRARRRPVKHRRFRYAFLLSDAEDKWSH